MTNPLRGWRLAATALPLALLGACAGGDKPKPAPAPSVIQAPTKAYVTVSDANDGAAIVLDPNQELRVELQLSGWEVAHNMDWSIADLKPGVLTTLGSRFERSTRDRNPLESDGSTVWRLKAQAPGRVTVSFALRRAYSAGPPQRSASFDVTVK